MYIQVFFSQAEYDKLMQNDSFQLFSAGSIKQVGTLYELTFHTDSIQRFYEIIKYTFSNEKY